MRAGPLLTTTHYVLRTSPWRALFSAAIAICGAAAHGFFLLTVSKLVRSAPENSSLTPSEAGVLLIGLVAAASTTLLNRVSVSRLWAHVRMTSRSKLLASLQTNELKGIHPSNNATHADAKRAKVRKLAISISHSSAVSSRYFVAFIFASFSAIGLFCSALLAAGPRTFLPFLPVLIPAFFLGRFFVARQATTEAEFKAASQADYSRITVVEDQDDQSKVPLSVQTASDKAVKQRYTNPSLARTLTTSLTGIFGVSLSLYGQYITGADKQQALVLCMAAIAISTQLGRGVEAYAILGRSLHRIYIYNNFAEFVNNHNEQGFHLTDLDEHDDVDLL